MQFTEKQKDKYLTRSNSLVTKYDGFQCCWPRRASLWRLDGAQTCDRCTSLPRQWGPSAAAPTTPLPLPGKIHFRIHPPVFFHTFPPVTNTIISSRGLQLAYFTPAPPQGLLIGVGQYWNACFVQGTGTEQELDSQSRFSSKFISRPFISSRHTMSNPLEITFSRKPCYWNEEMP